MKVVQHITIYLGISMALLGVMMFIYGISMFTARGDYSTMEIKLAEISFVFWVPAIFGGLVIAGIGFIIKGLRRSKIPS